MDEERHIAPEIRDEISKFLEEMETSEIRRADRDESVEQFLSLQFYWDEVFNIGADYEVCHDMGLATRMAGAPTAFRSLSVAMRDWGAGDMARLTIQLLDTIEDLRKASRMTPVQPISRVE